MKEIILIQHCESEHHHKKVAGGWKDWELTEFGRTQADCIGKRLRKEINNKEYELFSSDLLRASQTADIIGMNIGTVPKYDCALREINIGNANGKPIKWLEENRLTLPKNCKYVDFRYFEGAESKKDHYDRITKYLSLIEERGVERAIIVTHGGSIPIVIAWWLKIPLETFNYGYFASSAGSITYLGEGFLGLRVLKVLGDRKHLQNLRF